MKVKDKQLQVRNRIYRQLFDLAWVKENMAIDWVRIFAGAATLVATVAVSLLIRVWRKLGK